MFRSRPPKSGATVAVDTLIGSQTEIRGDLHFSGGLHVEGRVKGAVTGSDDEATSLSVGETGSIEGDVRADGVVVHGTVIGDVYARARLSLTSSAKIVGDVYYHLLEMASGATVNGNLVHSTESNATATRLSVTHIEPVVDIVSVPHKPELDSA